MEFFTIGVYNSTENEYFSKLSDNNIDTFCDIRQRRAVRGAKYAFVNSKRLQDKLSQMGLNYLHEIKLAPTKAIRELQKEADKLLKESKRARNTLGSVFTNEFNKQILEPYDMNILLTELKKLNADKVVLFCVEEHAKACHRSLVTNKLQELGYKITHL